MTSKALTLTALFAALAGRPGAAQGTAQLHTVSVDAVPINGLLLNATLYHYRPHAVGTGAPRDFQNRLRLNATVTF